MQYSKFKKLFLLSCNSRCQNNEITFRDYNGTMNNGLVKQFWIEIKIPINDNNDYIRLDFLCILVGDNYTFDIKNSKYDEIILFQNIISEILDPLKKSSNRIDHFLFLDKKE